MGGDGNGGNKNDVWRSTDKGATWSQMTAHAGWTARYGHSSVVMPDGRIVLVGGTEYGSVVKNDVWCSEDNGAEWTQVNASAGWSKRYYHSSVVLPDGSIVIMGGRNQTTLYNDVWRSEDNGATWIKVNASAGWSGRYAHSSVVMPDGSIVLMGGIGTGNKNDVWRSTDNGTSWTRITTDAEWSARYYHSSVLMPDGSIVLMGGYDGSSYKNDVWRFNPTGSSAQNPSHTYTTPGIYPVALQVYNSDGYNSMRKTGYITITGPPPTFISITPNYGPTAGGTAVTIVGTNFVSGGSFGVTIGGADAAAVFVNTTHITATTQPHTAGANDVVITNKDGQTVTGAGAYTYVAPLTLPVPRFTATPTTGQAPLQISFTDLSLNNPNGWAWYFGDEDFTEAWTQVNASAGWSARTGHSSVAMPDGSIVLIGGVVSDGPDGNDVWRSTDNGATWTQMTGSGGWSGSEGISSVAMPDGSIVLTGGWANGGKNCVWRSTDNGATWTQLPDAGWTGRASHSSVAMPDGSIVLMGGLGLDNNGYNYTYTNDVWRSMDNGATWTQVNASAGWTGRFSHSSVVMPDGSIVLIGGYDGSVTKNDVWRSTDRGVMWTQMTGSAGWPARSGPSSVAMPDGSIVLMGGYDMLGRENDVWRSTDNGATWMQVNASAGWSGRNDHSSVAMPDGSIVLMGGDDNGLRVNDVWRFMPAGSSAQNPSHTYTKPGIYQVALQVYNAAGYNSTRKTGYITVTSLPAPVSHPGINIAIENIIGLYMNAEHIHLFNGTWSDNATWDNHYSANWDGLAVGEKYTLFVGKAGYLNVSGDITVTGGNPQWVNVTLAQLGQLLTPRVVLSENGTTISGMERFYQAPTGEWVNNPANKHPELLMYNLMIAGNDSIEIALEFMERLTVHPLDVKLDTASISYQYTNGTLTIDDNRLYTTTNATMQVIAPAGNNGKIIHLIFSGTVRGDNNNDGVVDITDRAFGNQVYLRQRAIPPAYDYGDVADPDHVFDLTDVAYITQNFLGQRDY
jgi:uncharacterized delta-60 repeat protein